MNYIELVNNYPTVKDLLDFSNLLHTEPYNRRNFIMNFLENIGFNIKLEYKIEEEVIYCTPFYKGKLIETEFILYSMKEVDDLIETCFKIIYKDYG